MSASAPLNLLNLAKAEPGHPKSALTCDLSVQALTQTMTLAPARVWLLVLEGELIVDLPHGDFRVLKVGDSVQVDAERAVLTPLQLAVFLFQKIINEATPKGSRLQNAHEKITGAKRGYPHHLSISKMASS